MRTDAIVLECTSIEVLLEDTDIYQTEDGTVFYLDNSSPVRLYVKWKGRELEAVLPSYKIRNIASYGPSLYMECESQIYYIQFIPELETINVLCIRKVLEDEKHEGDLYSRMKDGKLFVHRMCDDPENDGVPVNDHHKQLGKAKLVGIHRGKAIYASHTDAVLPSLRCLSDHFTLLEISEPSNFVSYVQESSRFVFIAKEQSIITLDTKTMEFLPELRIGSVDFIFSMFVCKDVITIKSESEGEEYLITARLPCEFIDGVTHREDISTANKDSQIEITKNLKNQNNEMEEMLQAYKTEALNPVTAPLEFQELEVLTKPLICSQLENGTIIYFDNAKPFELFTMVNGNRQNADLSLLCNEDNCSFRGVKGNCAYFSTVRKKINRFFKACIQKEEIVFEFIGKMDISDCCLFERQPLYYIEGKEWTVHQYEENVSGKEKFDIFDVDFLSKHKPFYHRRNLYLFREFKTASIKRVNEKVVTVTGRLIDLDVDSFYAPPNSHIIYILNPDEKVLLLFDTINLSVSRLSYHVPTNSKHLSIVGIHEGILTMTFNEERGQILATTTVE